jgi:hypothetical protein
MIGDCVFQKMMSSALMPASVFFMLVRIRSTLMNKKESNQS